MLSNYILHKDNKNFPPPQYSKSEFFLCEGGGSKFPAYRRAPAGQTFASGW